MVNPRISVIIPTYNGSSWLAETIASVTSQTFQDFEIIIVDDGSKENIKHYLPTDPRIIFIRQDNAGTSASRNKALHLARGELIAFLDHDDKWLPEKLEKQLDLLDRYPQIGFVFCDYISFGTDEKRPNGFSRGTLSKLPFIEAETGIFLLNNSDIFDFLLDDLFVQIPSTWMIRSDILMAVGGFEPLLRRGGEDLHLALRVANKCNFAFHQDAMTMRREFPQSLSALSNWQAEMLLVLNLLWEKGDLSNTEKSNIFARRRECARNLARLDIKAGLNEDAQRKLLISLEGSLPFHKSTLISIFYLLKTIFKIKFSPRDSKSIL